MKIHILVDTNIIISALLGGKPRFILFHPQFRFITVQSVYDEVFEYIPLISKKSFVPEGEVKKGIYLLPITIIPRGDYQMYLQKAQEIMEHIDPDDAELLALYLSEGTYIWSQDKDFEQAQSNIEIRLLKTEDFII